MTDPFNGIPATLLSELTVVYCEKQRKHVYAVLEQNAKFSDIKANNK